jgi:mxaD protein
MNKIIRSCVGAASLMAASSFAAGSLAVSREIIVDRPPATVWKLMGEFNALDVWLPPIVSSTLTGEATKLGAIRVLDLGGNASVTEKLVAYSSARHSYSYAFLKSPLPVKNYVATIELRATPDGKTLIKWYSTFDANGAPDDKAKEAIQGIYDVGLAKVASIFRKASP